MTDAPQSGRKNPPRPREKTTPADPDWARGLKKMYDSVVEEDLPDSFKDLLSRLDDEAP